VEDDEKVALFGLALGVGLGLWATIGDGGVGDTCTGIVHPARPSALSRAAIERSAQSAQYRLCIRRENAAIAVQNRRSRR